MESTFFSLALRVVAFVGQCKPMQLHFLVVEIDRDFFGLAMSFCSLVLAIVLLLVISNLVL